MPRSQSNDSLASLASGSNRLRDRRYIIRAHARPNHNYYLVVTLLQ